MDLEVPRSSRGGGTSMKSEAQAELRLSKAVRLVSFDAARATTYRIQRLATALTITTVVNNPAAIAIVVK